MYRRSAAARRPGFTLLELLISIVIIAILVALTVGVVFRAFAIGQRTQGVSEINQLATACNSFKTDYGFVPPATFTVPVTRTTSDPNYQLLKRMFGRVWIDDGGNIPWTTAATGASWLPTPPSMTPLVLDPNQCLVFFLGGPSGQGWGQSQPWGSTAGVTAKKGPYYEFPLQRLQTMSRNGSLTAANGLPWFVDPWGTPYLYFAAGASGYTGTSPSGITTTFYTTGPNSQPVNPSGFQIVSAGKNTAFGPGGQWTPGSSTSYVATSDAGFDDLANFNNGVQLGVNPNP